ncbi:MAG: hypothetical protein JNL83_26905 [Myxococcales bacterium]|nr:hypothetical protein [Myxococcales bacterium]
MRWSLPAVVLLAGCPPKPPVPPKPPNTDLIAGVYERHKPDGETAIRFETNGSYRIAKNREQFDVDPPVGTGTYKIDGDTLVMTADKGQCAEAGGTKEGTYKVVLSKVGIRWTRVADRCEARSRYDGQTWWRVR